MAIELTFKDMLEGAVPDSELDYKICECEEDSVCECDDEDIVEYLETDEPLSDEEYDELDEAVKRKRLWRKGKRVIKMKSDRVGYKVKDGKEVRMTPQERMKRKRAAKKAGRKGKAARKRSAKITRRRMGKKS